MERQVVERLFETGGPIIRYRTAAELFEDPSRKNYALVGGVQTWPPFP
jgi:hypothetical protein